MEENVKNMIKNYFISYSKTAKFKKSMLLSMLTIFNESNIENSSDKIHKNPSNCSLYDINHISNKIAVNLNSSHSMITIEQCKILCDVVLSLAELLDDIDTTLFQQSAIDEKIDRIYSEIDIFNISRRFLTREEFFSIDSYKIENHTTFNDIENTPPERAQESKLKKYGYSVAWDNHLSTKKRQDLLRDLIESGKVSKGYVISYLKHNIQINGKKESNEFAVMKWKEDLDFIYKL